MIRKIVSIFFFLLVAADSFSEDIRFTASAPNVVATGETFQMSITVNASGADLRFPDLSGFEVLSGPNSSQSTNIQMINGQFTQSVTFSYTFYLKGTKEGKFTIKPASIKIKGKEYTTNTLTIEVVKGSASAQGNTQQNNSSGQTQSDVGDVSNKELFVKILVDKNTVYQGEHIIATIKIYTRVDLMGFNDMKFPEFNGFYSQDIETPSQISLTRENVNGQIYNVGLIKKYILFPQKSGSILIEPFELGCAVKQKVQRRSNSFFDDFFYGSYQRVDVKIKSTPVKITVRALPSNYPGSFNGAVGNLKMDASLTKTSVKTNDAITLKIKLSGNGNLKLIDPIKIDFPTDFETYDPKVESNISNTPAGSSGSKTFEYLLIPRHAGKYTIPPVIFSYFDIPSGQYKTLESQEFNIEVAKGSNNESTNIVSGFGKEDVKFIGSDIRFIKTKPFAIYLVGETFSGSLNFYLFIFIPLGLFLFIFLIRRKKIKENANIARLKNRKANKMSRKRLKKAAVYLKQHNKELFYEEIVKALWGYLSDKLSIPVSDLSRETAIEAMKKQNTEQEMINQFMEIADKCEYARYAPAGATDPLNDIYARAADMINKLERKLK